MEKKERRALHHNLPSNSRKIEIEIQVMYVWKEGETGNTLNAKMSIII